MFQQKRFFHLFLAICLLLILTAAVSACSGEKGSDNATIVVDMTTLGSQLQKELGLAAELSPVEEEVFRYVYDISPDAYQEQILLLSTGATADEICLVKTADKNSQKEIKEKMNARITAQKESFASYLPEEAAKLENAVITEVGDYIFLIICSEPQKAHDIIAKTLQPNEIN